MTRRQGNLLFSLPLLFVLYTFIVSEKRHLDTTRNEQKQLEAAVFVAPPASSSTTSANATSNSTRPPFKSLTDNKGNVKADVQWLLDFSIIGFAKCGKEKTEGGRRGWCFSHFWRTSHRNLDVYGMASQTPRTPVRAGRSVWSVVWTTKASHSKTLHGVA